MGCPKLTWSDYIRLVEPAGKTAYSRIFHKVTDDPIGNRIRYQDVSYAYNKLNQITSMSDAAEGSPFPFHYDNWGNLVKTPEWAYKFDLHNRLIEAKSPKVTVKYSYDPLGQRIKSVEKTSDSIKNTEFLMSGMVEQARMTKDGEMFHTMGLDLKDSLKKTGGVGAYLASSAGNEFDMYLYDGNGNITATTDHDGGVGSHIVYSPFGGIEKGPELAFNFSSKAMDGSGLCYYGYRFYSAELGRWLKRDIIQEVGGWNLYEFCENNSPNSHDLFGLVSSGCTASGGTIFNGDCFCGCDEWDGSGCCVNGVSEFAPSVTAGKCCPWDIENDKEEYDACITIEEQAFDEIYEQLENTYNEAINEIDRQTKECKSDCRKKYPRAPIKRRICEAKCTFIEGLKKSGILTWYNSAISMMGLLELEAYERCRAKHPCSKFAE